MKLNLTQYIKILIKFKYSLIFDKEYFIHYPMIYSSYYNQRSFNLLYANGIFLNEF